MENGTNEPGETMTVWIVQKLDWQYNDNFYKLEEDVPIKAFADPAAAQKHCNELTLLEQERWQTYSAQYEGSGDVVNFFGGFPRITTLDEEEFERNLEKMGLSGMPTWESSENDWRIYRN